MSLAKRVESVGRLDKVRFFSRFDIDESTGCWNWTGTINSRQGYGAFCFNGVQRLAHRVSWVIHFGQIPAGKHVLHKCDNTRCVNPAHLFTGTHQDNMDDMSSKGRARHPSGDNHPQRKSPELVLRGEDCGAAKLNAEQVLEIRSLIGVMPQNKIARMFGVTAYCIYAIKKGWTWRHVV